ncbi:MAG: putative metal-dependent hydrolase, partial [Acidobacteriota bacterium]|nr:putative metal-dependent hydrolase [Acidobacteriota bacterium]
MDLRYPIGPFEFAGTLSSEQRQAMIDQIAATPEKMRQAVKGLNDRQLDTPYRPEGWTVRQVVHHVPESHLHSYTRFKLAITEDEPTIKPYFENRWAKLDDAQTAPVELSLNLLDALHGRWVW